MSPTIWARPAACTGSAKEIPCALRQRLTGLERQRLRELGRTLTLAVEATCRNFDRGEREADVAGHLAHRLLREGVVPVDLRVASDDRLARYRQPTFKAAPILKRATIAITGRRFGLCASVTRTVSFGPVDERVYQTTTRWRPWSTPPASFSPGRARPIAERLPPGQANLREVQSAP